MKHTRSLFSGLVASAVALAMVSTLAAQTVEGVAKVVRVKGPARYSTGGNVWQPLHSGMVLRPGTTVQTGTEEGSYVDLVLGGANAPVPQPVVYRPYIPDSMATMAYQPSAEQNVVRVWQNSALGIDKLTSMRTGADVVSETQLDLKMGRITGNVKKMTAASKYEVKLPNGVAGVRGTLYDISAEGVVKVFVGSMVLAWVDPKSGNVTTQVIMGGQQYDARTGQITPVSAAEMGAFENIGLAMRVVTTPTPITLANNLAVTPISPVGFSGTGPLPEPVFTFGF